MPEIRRERPRGPELKIDDTEVVDRVLHFFETDDTARSAEKEARIQRYAKYRMWVEDKDWPFPNSSNVPLPDMMEKSLRMQDTLHNAVMSSRPVIGAKALDREDGEKEKNIDKLIDYQFFVDQPGEETIGDLADAFINDGVFVTFIPWIKEERETSDLRRFPPIPEDILPIDYFSLLLRRQFAKAPAKPANGSDGWDWVLQDQDGKRIAVSFFTHKDGRVEMVLRQDRVVFDGPRTIQKEWEEVLYPARAANLHIPGPSNPHGAAHVILVDYPTVDEILRLAASGFYDRLDKEDLDALSLVARATDNQEMREEKDALQGTAPDPEPDKKKAPTHGTLTRLMCFDIYDIDGDGKTEDVVWWVIKETKSLARAKWLTEAFPSNKLRRPLVHRSMLPVRGRVAGISFLEMLEGLHDFAKMTLDQTADANTIQIVPFFFYRPSGSMKPEIIRMVPGEGYPLNDPQRDVNFPQFNNQGQVFAINLFTMLMQMQDQLSTIGPLQEGQVPKGKASALRTVGGMALIAGQGEARPERILRRFFSGLGEIWSHVHGLNQNFLPEKKKIRVLGINEPGEDPYLDIQRGDVSGVFEFDFKANVLNTSKQALQQSIQALLGAYVNELTLQFGILDAEGFYKLLRKYGSSHGQDPDEFIKAPSPDAMKQRIFAEEAIATIIDGQIPDGVPAEAGGAAEHLQKLQAFLDPNQDLIRKKELDFDEFGLLTTREQIEVFRAYVEEVMERAALEQREQAMLAAARNFQGGGGQGGAPGRPPEGPPQSAELDAPLQPNELRDESLPGAGGGANTGVGQ